LPFCYIDDFRCKKVAENEKQGSENSEAPFLYALRPYYLIHYYYFTFGLEFILQ